MNRIQRLEYLEELGTPSAPHEITLRPLKDLTFANVAAFQDAFLDYVREGRTAMRVELTGVGFIDSAGVGVLVKLRKALEGAGGSLAILNPGRTVQNILKLVGLAGLVKQEVVPGAPPPPPKEAPKAVVIPEMPPIDTDDDVHAKVDQLLLAADGPGAGGPSSARVEVQENVTHQNAQALLDGLLVHLAKGVRHVRVDVAKVEFIDSAGVGILLKAARAFSGSGGDLTLVSPTLSLQRILKIVKLDRVLRIES